MESSIDTGDPWDLPDQEPPPAPVATDMSPFAESTGLFARVRSSVAKTESDEADQESGEGESADGASAEGAPADADEFAPAVSAESEADEFAGQAFAPTDVPSADEAVESVESVLHELESEPASEFAPEPVHDTKFDLVPPPSPEVAAMFETYSPDVPEDDFEDAIPAAEIPEIPEASVPPAYVPPVEAAPTPVYTPPADVVERAWQDPVEVDDYGVGDIEFGAPQMPEGAELPTGKATRSASEGSISRPVLLTTDSVGGANIAPVDMVVAVESVGDPGQVPAAVDRVLDALRDRCAAVGGEAVVSVRTDISPAGGAIMVTASGTAVNLL